jgi:chemotaxis protein CheX
MAFSTDLLKGLNTTGPMLEKALIGDVKNVFNSMVGLDHLLHLALPVDPASTFTDCISALVGLAGTYNGLVSLHVPVQLAQKITAQMLETPDSSEEEMEDALGELANILAGSFKSHLSDGSMDIRLSTPSVVSGKQYAIHIAKKPDVMTLLFDSEENWFMVALALEKD